jgi:crotonobetainyl-CoA:carnitine CoA-transferase CaiB-like acyl-CoA transferase
MNGSLAGLTVIDFTQVAAGPTCTMMLADRGAHVIKVEAPQGDIGRQLGPPWQGGHGAIFLALNRNKRSVVLDLKTSEGREAARELVSRADILVESFRPGVMDRLGLGYEALQAEQPSLVYCSISAYGRSGASRHKPGVDGIVQAVSGLMSVTGTQGGEPCKVQAPIVDMVTGFLATLSILDALRVRDLTGEGNWLDISMYGCALQLQQLGLASYFSSQEVPSACGSAVPYAAPNEAYPAQDGWVMVAAYHPQRWQAFCEVIGRTELAADTRFATSALRVANRAALTEIVAGIMRTRPKAEWIAAFEAADILCAPVADYAEVRRSADFADARLTVSFEHPEAGSFESIGPLRTGAHHVLRQEPPTPAPLVGEHSAEILADVLHSLARRPDRFTPAVEQQ